MMNHDGWLHALTGELHRRGLDPELSRHVVAEAATHLRDSGEAPLRVFGPPETYAAAVAESVGVPRPQPATAWSHPSAGAAGTAAPGRAHGTARPRQHPPGPVRLDVRGISKRYRRRPVLTGVDLTVRAGEIAAVVGANGAGKSTFLRICAGLISPDQGQVRVHGTLGYCPQSGGTNDYLYPDEHFVLVGAGRGLPRATARAAGREHAAALDWDPAGRTQARQLSGGTRQKLNLVMASLGEPDVLLLDEPYQGFDRGTYLDFWQQLWQWRSAGKAIVVVTHLLNQLDRVDNVLDLTPTREMSA
ncbi:ATP-binding cassette domain-containing protein [Plantactinospora soyae]|uniref:ABC-type Mn2+/Zn2+ transport system ATPase subunit n=1 Tax=Plantactinospora soyae TaxID=1544732 RepID=A0A927R2J0_9ACTN|nr:ATP-binding cassette domain-containing protein [Plantactinospora soyae]MBE1484589.1 ABC-type Mn2+/Zn2+ transport system ATPase subunit [Plantactinospora soyae]